MKFGRIRPAPGRPKFKFSRYTTASLPTPPTNIDYSPAAAPCLGLIYLNDRLGDCVCAGGAHLVGVFTGNAGQLFTCSDAQVQSDYEAIGGYVPGDPSTDGGCDEETAFAYWTDVGFADGTKLAGWVALDGTNVTEIKQAIWLFEGVMFAVELPDAWVNPFPAGPGFVWGVAGPPNPKQGHCVVGVGYNAQGVIISTWGILGLITWEAVAKYAVSSVGGAIYGLLSPDVLARASCKSPAGVEWSELQADIDVMKAT